MPQTPKDPSVMTLEELGREMRLRDDSHQHLAAKAEFNLRQMRAQIEATEAQKAAAKAEEIAANATVEERLSGKCVAYVLFGDCRACGGPGIRLLGVLCVPECGASEFGDGPG